jgi:hypothetical protein
MSSAELDRRWGDFLTLRVDLDTVEIWPREVKPCVAEDMGETARCVTDTSNGLG